MLRRDFLTMVSTFAAATALGAPDAKHSKKKGLGLTTRDHPNWGELHRKLNLSWVYTWGSNVPEALAPGTEFVPMIWGYNKNDDQILKSAAKAKEAGATTLLGFNEPDHHDQSNLKVETVLDVWPVLMKTGMRRGSPAPAHATREWMTAFMKGVKERNLRVDFISAHFYPGTDADGFVNQMKKVSALYEKPIWITEFAVADWSAKTREENRVKPEQVLTFMRKVIPKLEALDCVERYAWFAAGQQNRKLGPSALFDPEGKLTPLGEFYASV